MPASGALTYEDLASFPDDGLRRPTEDLTFRRLPGLRIAVGDLLAR